jgi:Raf kinase inhibitor-like YbhB/YbcL family protein
MKGPLARLIGWFLRGVRAGDEHLSVNHPGLRDLPQTITLRSEWFAHGASIPPKAAGRRVGENISPPLTWEGVPKEARGYLLVIQDPDAPLPRPFVHLVALGIAPEQRALAQNELAENGAAAPYGRNTFGGRGYQGPRALPGHGPHRYVFHLMALSQPPQLETGGLGAILKANVSKVVAHGVLVGTFEQK